MVVTRRRGANGPSQYDRVDDKSAYSLSPGKTSTITTNNISDGSDDESLLSDNKSTLILFIISLSSSALLVLQVLVYLPSLTSTGNKVAFTAISIMCVVVYTIYRTMIRLGYETSLLNVFLCVCCFTAAVDLGIAGYLLNIWKLGSFYILVGEPYFNTAYGIGVLGYDGVVHLILQSIMCYRSLQDDYINIRQLNKRSRYGLVWGGSIINSMLPLLIGGAATGIFSSSVEMSTAMNAPYVLIPVIIVHTLFNESSSSRIRQGSKLRKSDVLSNLHYIMLSLTHLCLVILLVVRTMSVLKSDATIAKYWLTVEPVLEQDDGTNVILIDTIQALFWIGPYHLYSIFECYIRATKQHRGCLANGNWSSLIMGAYIQSSFIRVFMTCAKYASPGIIDYSFHLATLVVNLFVVSVALFHSWSMHDE